MSMLTTREALRIIAEVTYRTDPTPGATDSLKFENLGFNPAANLVLIEPRPVQANFIGDPHSVVSNLFEFTFDVELKGSGTPGTAPDFGPLLLACGWSETIDPGVSVIYKPASLSIPSVTIWYYADGLLYKGVGFRGNVTFKTEANGRMLLSFTMLGHSSGDPSDSALVDDSSNWDDEVAEPFQNATFTVDGYAAIFSNLAFDGGANVISPADVNQSNGVGEIQITAPRDMKGSFDPEAVLVATEAFHANWKASTSQILTTGAIGASAGNITTITMPVIRYSEPGHGDRDGIRTFEMGFQAYDSSGDDAVSIILT